MIPLIAVLTDLTRRAAEALRKKVRAINRSRPAFLVGSVLAAAAAALPVSPTSALDTHGGATRNWVGTWSTAPTGPPLPADLLQFSNQTLRLIVHTSIGGSRVRIRLSNEFGNTGLRIGAAHVALRQAGAIIVEGSDRVLTFSGSTSTTIPPGASVLSDPVDLNVSALSDLAISIYVPEAVQANTIHRSAFQTSYVSSAGDHTGATALRVSSPARTIASWPFLTGVDVTSSTPSASIVVLGDSITDGSNSTGNANQRWTDVLALRLQNTRISLYPIDGASRRQLPNLPSNTSMLGVLNNGISGNRLLQDPGAQQLFGRAALVRFDRDVLTQAGIKYLIVLIGINDIGRSGTGTIPASNVATDLIAGYRRLIARAHHKGITVFGATLTPYEGTISPGYYSPEKEAVRVAINQWIRTSGAFDGVIDFEAAVRDPARPSRMLPAYDSGDHLHPNDAGMQAMGNAVPLELFRDNKCCTAKGPVAQ